MKPERYQQIDDLLARALEVETRERQAFVERECAERPETLAQVERLLAADVSGPSFLETPPPRAFAELPPIVPGGRLGAYRIESEIARGGMGTVYLASRDDGQYQRRVAIKRLHRVGLGEDGAARFRDERRILAGLEHPHIARLYDAGELPGGEAFLVMEYIEGEPISAHCDRLLLSLEARLRLFLKVLAAVGYAHQNLLVHRDLKPENILVDAQGEPRLIDFGIAKQLPAEESQAAVTQISTRFMTPRYASPEQMRGERISTASDIYSLGVVLYELITGLSPYRLESLLPHQALAAVLEQVPPKPSEAVKGQKAEVARSLAAARDASPAQLARSLAGDLDTIVLKALAKEVSRRYNTASELGADIESYLGGKPVAARPDTLAYRTVKFVRRHRWGVSLAASTLLLLGAQQVRLVGEKRTAIREGARTEQAMSFLVRLFEQADPYASGGKQVTADQLLTLGAEWARRDLAQEPATRATVLAALGRAEMGLGRYDEALPALNEALELRRSSEPSDLVAVAEEIAAVAWLKTQQADYDAAESLFEEALRVLRGTPRGRRSPELAGLLNRFGAALSRRHQRSDPQRSTQIELLHREALSLFEQVDGPKSAGVADSLY